LSAGVAREASPILPPGSTVDMRVWTGGQQVDSNASTRAYRYDDMMDKLLI
jgi:hypothetical protein